MSKQIVTKGATSQSFDVWIRDSSSSVGAGLTGLVFNSGSLVASYKRTAAARVAITLATQTVTGAFSSGGFVEVDATNMPGLYRLDVPDAAFASGVAGVVVMLKGAANMEPCVMEFELKALDLQDGVRAGLTALPNAAAGAAGGVVTSGTGAAQLATSSGQVLLQAGTGAGQLDFTSGVVKASLAQVLGTAITGTAAQLAAAFTKFFNVATPTGTVNSLPDAVPGAAGGLPTCDASNRVLIQSRLQKNASGGLRVPFQMTDSTNHNPASGKTVTLTRSLAGAAFGGGTIGAVVEIANGWYYADFAAADINANNVLIDANATGCDTTPIVLFLEP